MTHIFAESYDTLRHPSLQHTQLNHCGSLFLMSFSSLSLVVAEKSIVELKDTFYLCKETSFIFLFPNYLSGWRIHETELKNNPRNAASSPIPEHIS